MSNKYYCPDCILSYLPPKECPRCGMSGFLDPNTSIIVERQPMIALDDVKNHITNILNIIDARIDRGEEYDSADTFYSLLNLRSQIAYYAAENNISR